MAKRLACTSEQLHRMWASGMSYADIAAALGCAQSTVHNLKERYKLPPRKRRLRPDYEVDPTPEQIAERAAQCRAEREKNMPPPAPYRPGIREYRWQCGAYHGRT